MKRWLRMLAVTGLVFALGVMGLLPPAHALQLSLSDGGTPTVITDNIGSDLDGRSGVVLFAGSVGSFNVVVSTGISRPQIGSVVNPEMDLNSIEVSGGTGTLAIMLTDQGFTGLGSSRLTIGGTTSSGNVTYKAYFDSSNQAFGGVGSPSNLLGTSGLLTGPFIGEDLQGAAAPSDTSSYSLTQVVTITHTGSNSVSSLDAHLSVPEPSLSLLLGMSFVSVFGFGYIYQRRKR